MDLGKPSLVVATVLRDPKSTLNASDGSPAPLRVPHGRENLKPPQVLARVAIGTMPVPELEYGRRVDARGGRARVGLESEPGLRVLDGPCDRGDSPAHAFLNAVRPARTEHPRQVARWIAARQLQILWSWRALLHSVTKKPNRPLGESED